MNNSKNLKTLKYGVISIVLLFVINVAFYIQLKISEPVFLKHYYDLYIHHSGTLIDIHYIADSSDERRIANIEFPQMPEEFARLSKIYDGFGPNEGQKFAHFKYNVVSGSILYDTEVESEEIDSVVIDKAIITYSNGDKQEVDIGKIIIHKNFYPNDFIDTSYNSSSSDFTSSTGIRPTENITIESIGSTIDEKTSGFLVQTLDGVDFKDLTFPIKVARGEEMDIKSKFLYNTDNIKKYNVYEVHQLITSTNEEGSVGKHRLLNIDYEPIHAFSNERGIIKYLKLRGIL